MSHNRDGEQYRRDGEGNLFARLRRGPSRRSQFESIVDRLELPQDWTLAEFFTSMERIRGRPILQLPLPEHAPPTLCGLWLSRSHDDVVLYRRSSDPMLERHVVVHECAHMLLGHGRKSSLGELATLLAGVDGGRGVGSSGSMVQGARGASAYDDPDEYDAELLATMIAGRREGILRRDRRTLAA